MIEIRPASLSQVIKGKGGRLITIDNDVCGIAKQLEEIDSRARLKYSEEGEYFMVVLAGAGAHGRDHLVTTSQNLHSGLVDRFRGLASGQVDPGSTIEAREAQIDRERDQKFSEEVGELSEKLAHAIRTDLRKARPGPVYIPPDIHPPKPRK